MTASTSSETPQTTPASSRRLVVVSNRLPLTLTKGGDGWSVERSSGGLATAMGPLLERTGGIWIGWSGHGTTDADRDDPAKQRILDEWAANHAYHTVDLAADVARGFYEGFSNETLWPVFHHFPFLLKFNPDHWAAYVEANTRFRDVILQHLRPGDLVWVHDYQLLLLPQLLREAAPDVRVGFFLHIPFPASTVFRVLPRGDELLQGLLGADYLAFHTHTDLQNFRSCVLRSLGISSGIVEVDLGVRSVRLEALPIGIDADHYADMLDSEEVSQRRGEIANAYRGKHLLLGVDRLDYTKGIPERLRSFRRFLRMNPEFHGTATLVQVAVPSRQRIEAYKDLGQETDELVGHINGEFGTPDWTPVVYMRRGVPPTELTALYASADVALVTPLRDGMNLVAKEFVACQQGRGGVLVLSEFAGAAAELGEALRVNPYDDVRTAEAIARALKMPEDERRRRMAAMYERVTRNNVFAWGERFVEALRDATDARLPQGVDSTVGPPELPFDRIAADFARAKNRLILLDYDGTLAFYAKRPEEATPPPGLIERLTQLAADPFNHVAIISGRSRADIEGWLGGVPGLWLAAEHGAAIRQPGGEWETPRAARGGDWKRRVRDVLNHYIDRTPGSFIEEKEFALVWHYRLSDPDFAEWIASELLLTLEQGLASTELRAMRGRKTVEVKLTWANKGEVMARLEHACRKADFILAAGDDKTDEDLFAVLPHSAWTIHVGDQATRARFRVDGVADMHRLLEKLAAQRV